MLVGIAEASALVGSALRPGIKLCSAGTFDGDTPLESRLCRGAIFEFGMRFVARLVAWRLVGTALRAGIKLCKAGTFD